MSAIVGSTPMRTSSSGSHLDGLGAPSCPAGRPSTRPGSRALAVVVAGGGLGVHRVWCRPSRWPWGSACRRRTGRGVRRTRHRGRRRSAAALTRLSSGQRSWPKAIGPRAGHATRGWVVPRLAAPPAGRVRSGDDSPRRPARRPPTCPATPFSGSAMPMPPPTTQAICSSVSDRAKAEVRTSSGTSRWISASSDSLRQRLRETGHRGQRAPPVTDAEEDRGHHGRRASAHGQHRRDDDLRAAGLQPAPRAPCPARCRRPPRRRPCPATPRRSGPPSGCSRSRKARKKIRKPDRPRSAALRLQRVQHGRADAQQPRLAHRRPGRLGDASSSADSRAFVLALRRVDLRRQRERQERRRRGRSRTRRRAASAGRSRAARRRSAPPTAGGQQTRRASPGSWP